MTSERDFNAKHCPTCDQEVGLMGHSDANPCPGPKPYTAPVESARCYLCKRLVGSSTLRRYDGAWICKDRRDCGLAEEARPTMMLVKRMALRGKLGQGLYEVDVGRDLTMLLDEIDRLEKELKKVNDQADKIDRNRQWMLTVATTRLYWAQRWKRGARRYRNRIARMKSRSPRP